MLRSIIRRQKMPTPKKGGGLNDEKYGQALVEYIYEQNLPNDPAKRREEIDTERLLSFAFDRYTQHGEKCFENQMSNLVRRMNEAMAEIPPELLGEACLLNSEQPPLSLKRPALTPPVPEYRPAFGQDVPQLKASQSEYPFTERPTEELMDNPQWPLCDPEEIAETTRVTAESLEQTHGAIRSQYPYTGVEGEAWEASIALNKRAVARQQLILDLLNDPLLQEQYDGDELFREEEKARRGILPLMIEEEEDVSRIPVHYAQEPKHAPPKA